jgi:release factor glutamine methyltransferase
MSVYPVREDTLLVKRSIEEENLQDKKFLEIGVGNGEISLKAAGKGAEVTAVDIDGEAIEYAEERFEETDLEAKIFQSDLFAEIEGEFDFIVFNPPYLPGPEVGDENMWRGGETGLETAEKFLEQAANYLSERGKVWMVLSSHTDYGKLVEEYDLNPVDEKKVWFERVFLFEYE